MSALVGGMTEPRPATAEDQAICDSVKFAVENELGEDDQWYMRIDGTYTYKAVLVATQLVNGINYFVKLDIGAGEELVHARIYKPFDGAPTLSGIQFPKTMDDPLVYFE